MVLNEMVNETMFDSKNDDSEKVIIFQSMNNVQIMLPELGFVNALRAYFELHKIDYLIDQRSNVEFMSPDGELPLIKYGYKLISGYEPIIEFIQRKKNIDVESKRDRPDEWAHMQLFEKVIIQAELLYTWLDKDIYEKFTKFNYSYGKPWPLNNILCWLKRRDVASRIVNIENKNNELEAMLDEICRNINNDYKYNLEFLCLFYGHIKAILSLEPFESLHNLIKDYPTLIGFYLRFEEKIHSTNI